MALNLNRLKIYLVPLLFIVGSILTGLMLIFPTVEQTLVVRSETAILEEKRFYNIQACFLSCRLYWSQPISGARTVITT